jgi:hypothetical protein
MIRLRILVLAMLCVTTTVLHAQPPYTQPREERIVYDTLFVHDTLHVADTINIGEYIRSQTFRQLFDNTEYTDLPSLPDSLKIKYEQAVTFSENLVFNNRDQNYMSMDSIKKIISAGLIVLAMNGVAPAQTDSIQTVKLKSKISYYHALGVDYVLCPVAMAEQDNHKYFDMGTRLHVLNGIEFNPWLILSLDLQFAYTHCYDEDLTIVMPMKGISNGSKNAFTPFENIGFKLGLDFRYRLLNRFKWSPVIGIAGGPSIELTSYPKQEGEYSSYWGWGGYISSYLGCSYRYRNNKQLWFGASWTVDFGYIFIAIPLLGFRFEIQL